MKLFSLMMLAALFVTGTNALAEETAEEKKVAESAHDFTVKSLDGKDVDLSEYKGKVLLVVNVASQCGATPQYRQLQAMYEKYADKGLVVMGFPCNQFGAQEPGSEDDIREFCTSRYNVKFPMFAKVNVNGKEQSPLYDFLKTSADDHSNIGWNFEKFIVGKDGKVSARFPTATKPDAPEVIRLLEEELTK